MARSKANKGISHIKEPLFYIRKYPLHFKILLELKRLPTSSNGLIASKLKFRGYSVADIAL